MTISVPEVSIPRYKAPDLRAKPVSEVISPVPADESRPPGQYQTILLDVRTGELSFHESAEHLEERPAAAGDVPAETWQRWHPGRLFSPGGPHMWFEPVPGILSWVVNTGFGRPYLSPDQASALVGRAAVHAENLLAGLWCADGELDWSAAAARAGRSILRVCSLDGRPARRLPDDDLADYSEIIRGYPQVFDPRLLAVPAGQLAGECESITRFLGANEHWHPEIRQSFGNEYRLDVLGVRAWYRTARAAG